MVLREGMNVALSLSAWLLAEYLRNVENSSAESSRYGADAPVMVSSHIEPDHCCQVHFVHVLVVHT